MQAALRNREALPKRAWFHTCHEYMKVAHDYDRRCSDLRGQQQQLSAFRQRVYADARQLAELNDEVPARVIEYSATDAAVLLRLQQLRFNRQKCAKFSWMELLPELVFMTDRIPAHKRWQLMPMQAKVEASFFLFDTSCVLQLLRPADATNADDATSTITVQQRRELKTGIVANREKIHECILTRFGKRKLLG